MKTVLVLLVSIISLSANAQWQCTSYYGRTLSLAWNGSVIVASDTFNTSNTSQSGEEYSSDFGQTWHRSQNGTSAADIIVANGSDLYCSSSEYIGSGPWVSTLWRSQDNAQTWTKLVSMTGDRVYAISDVGFYFNTDSVALYSADGITWSPFDSSRIPHDVTLSAKAQFRIYAIDSLLLGTLSDPQTLAYLTFVSSNQGMTWAEYAVPDSLSVIAYYQPSTMIACHPSGGHSALMRSSDMGHTWSIIPGTAQYSGYWSWFSDNGDCLFAYSLTKYLLSTDRGVTWKTFDTEGLQETEPQAFTVGGGFLFLAIYDSIYRRPLGSATVAQSEVSKVRMYPNPAQTTLHLSGSDPNGRATISDALGRTVLETSVAANGEIDIHTLPSGTYTLMLSASKHFRFVK